MCESARKNTRQMLEFYAREPTESRDKKRYRGKGNAAPPYMKDGMPLVKTYVTETEHTLTFRT